MTPAIDLRKLRVDLGLSLKAAAEQMGVDSDALARAETGKATPHPRNALKIASFYGHLPTDVWPLDNGEQAA